MVRKELKFILILQQRPSVISKSSSVSPSPSNGSITLPSVPAPVKPIDEVVTEFPGDTGRKSTLEDFQFIKVLGKGSFGKVWLKDIMKAVGLHLL